VRLRENLVPPPGLPRRLATQNLLFGIGAGTFSTGSAVFFTRVVGLAPHEIGIGLSVAAGVALATAVPLSALADRHGPKRTWAAGMAGSAVLFAAWPLASGFWTFLAAVTLLELVNSVAHAGRNVYLIEALEPRTRLRTQAFSRAWLNVGWSLGAGLAALALAVDTLPAYLALPLVNSVLLAVNAVVVARLPAAPRGGPAPTSAPRRAVFADRPFLTVAAVCAVLLSLATVQLEVAPLWLLTHTDAPTWWLGVLTLLNTVLATTMQVAMTRGAHTVEGAVRALRWGGLAAAAGCPLYLLAGATSGVATMAVFVLATIMLVLSEMWQSAGSWTLAAELPPPDRRGTYFGAFRMGNAAQNMIAPAALIALAVTTGGWGWLVISGIFLAATVAIGPAVARFVRTRDAALAAAAEARSPDRSGD
jgi:MFS family permease